MPTRKLLECVCKLNFRSYLNTPSPVFKFSHQGNFGVLLIRRPFTKNIRAFIKSSGYTKEQQGYILGIINKSGGLDLPSKLIGDSNAKRIRAFLQKVGFVEKLEDLLQVQGLGPQSLRKVCDRILSSRDESSNSETIDPPAKRNKRIPANLIEPSLTEEQISNLTNVTAVHLGSNVVSWAILDCRVKDLLNWGIVDVPVQAQKFSPIAILETVKEVSSYIPTSEFYIFEDVNWSNLVGAQISASSHVLKAQLTAALVTLLSERKENIFTPTICFLKSRLSGQVFNTFIGREKVSSQSVIEDIFHQRLGGNHSNIFISKEVRDVYNEQKHMYREDMASALLLALAFMDTIVYSRINVGKPSKMRGERMSVEQMQSL